MVTTFSENLSIDIQTCQMFNIQVTLSLCELQKGLKLLNIVNPPNVERPSGHISMLVKCDQEYLCIYIHVSTHFDHLTALTKQKAFQTHKDGGL